MNAWSSRRLAVRTLDDVEGYCFTGKYSPRSAGHILGFDVGGFLQEDVEPLGS